MNLYLVKTRSFRAYVVASGTDIAYQKFRELLDRRDYGYSSDRDFASVELVAATGGKGYESPRSDCGCAFDDSRKDDLLILTNE